MPRKEQIRDVASVAEMRLRETGSYRMQNDEPGLAFAVCEELRRMYPGRAIEVEHPRFGGEAVFRSADHLGCKAPGAEP